MYVCYAGRPVGAGAEDEGEPCAITEQGVLSFDVARFCFVFPCDLRGPVWAVGSFSISQSAGGTSRNIIFKTLRQIGRPALYLL